MAARGDAIAVRILDRLVTIHATENGGMPPKIKNKGFAPKLHLIGCQELTCW